MQVSNRDITAVINHINKYYPEAKIIADELQDIVLKAAEQKKDSAEVSDDLMEVIQIVQKSGIFILNNNFRKHKRTLYSREKQTVRNIEAKRFLGIKGLSLYNL